MNILQEGAKWQGAACLADHLVHSIRTAFENTNERYKIPSTNTSHFPSKCPELEISLWVTTHRAIKVTHSADKKLLL